MSKYQEALDKLKNYDRYGGMFPAEALETLQMAINELAIYREVLSKMDMTRLMNEAVQRH